MPNFSHTCSSINYDPNSTILSAECQARDGEWLPTELRLSDHIGNIDGELQFGDQNFQETCQDCHLEFGDGEQSVWLVCTCQTMDGEWKPTQILLDSQIDNNDSNWKSDRVGEDARNPRFRYLLARKPNLPARKV